MASNVLIAIDPANAQRIFLEGLRSAIPALSNATIIFPPNTSEAFAQVAQQNIATPAQNTGVVIMTIESGGIEKGLPKLLDNWKQASQRPVLLQVPSSFEKANGIVNNWFQNAGISELRNTVQISDGYNTRDIAVKLQTSIKAAVDQLAALASPLSNSGQLASVVVDPRITGTVISPIKTK